MLIKICNSQSAAPRLICLQSVEISESALTWGLEVDVREGKNNGRADKIATPNCCHETAFDPMSRRCRVFRAERVWGEHDFGWWWIACFARIN